MPLLTPSTYRPPAYLWNGHLQTIVPSQLRRVEVSYRRERIDTPDGDFLDLDWAFAQTPTTPASTLVILSHGLEGSSRSPYLAGMARHLTQHGYDCLAWHYRSCGGDMNRTTRFYHLGDTADLHFVLTYALSKAYKTIHLVGFSAGGSITLKYAGEQGTALHPAVGCAVVFSVPLDLLGSTRRLERWDSLIYNYRFSRTLKRKVHQKAQLMPHRFPLEAVRKTRGVRDFDNVFTAPMNGFRDATDYYTQSSALPYLTRIAIPTLVVNARNDPFLSEACFPEQLARQLESVWMEFPAAGGHCGFVSRNGSLHGTYWSETRTTGFFETYKKENYERTENQAALTGQ